jgi:hypothetical protein
LLYRRRNTLIKECILPSLQIAVIIIKIKTETITEITEIVTKIIKTLAVIKYMDNLIVTVDLRDVAISTKKRITIYKNI